MHLQFLLSSYVWTHNNKIIKLLHPNPEQSCQRQELAVLLLQKWGGKEHDILVDLQWDL